MPRFLLNANLPLANEKIKELNTDDLTAKLQIESEEIAETLGLLNPLSPYRQDTGANNLGVFEVPPILQVLRWH